MSGEITGTSESGEFAMKLRYARAQGMLVGACYLLTKMTEEQKLSDYMMLAACNLVEQAMDEKKIGDRFAKETGTTAAP
jgi:hypothetical protein